MEDCSKIISRDLAEILLNKTEKEMIISEIFNSFGFDCIARCHIEPARLDGLIKDFEKSDYKDAEILTEIIEVIRNGKKDSFAGESALLEEIREYVSANLSDDISVEKMAEKLNVSYYYICHFFKQQTNISITAFKNQKRVEKAAKLLTCTDKKVTDSPIHPRCSFPTAAVSFIL